LQPRHFLFTIAVKISCRPEVFHRTSPVEVMLSAAIALGILVIILPAAGLLWFWFVRSSES
jgi:hypothetical protein